MRMQKFIVQNNFFFTNFVL